MPLYRCVVKKISFGVAEVPAKNLKDAKKLFANHEWYDIYGDTDDEDFEVDLDTVEKIKENE